ncbi:MAG: ATP-dependent DNA helicase RecG [Parvularculales bacterium]
MRPDILFPLFADVKTLPGVGSRLAPLLAKLAGERVVDLCWHLPSGFVDRTPRASLDSAEDGSIITLEVLVERHIPPPTKRLPYRVSCSDMAGETINLTFFRANVRYLKEVLPEGENRFISGRLEYYRDAPQMSHPDHILTPDDFGDMAATEPVYPLTTDLTPKPLRRIMRSALERAPKLSEWLTPERMQQHDWPDWQTSLLTAHAPDSNEALDPLSPARMRLAYDELLANQLALILVRKRMRRLPGRAMEGDRHLRDKVLAGLPYKLTAAQQQAIKEIEADMAAPVRMLRLLQGDVGSGKTIVALMAMLTAVEGGSQAALMAPTELLARQHLSTLSPLCEACGVRIELLTSNDKGAARRALLDDLECGDIALLVGTHALFQKDVTFHKLDLIVVDEQHRFGVHQRMELSAKGGGSADVLIMTATPIPRTLTLTTYGHMDISRLMEKPPGRQSIVTRAVPFERLPDITEKLATALKNNARAYWVCPVVEESDEADITAATERHEMLTQLFGEEQVGLVHGRMKAGEKDAVMADFKEGRIRLLVATTVVEVGVDVPEATIMVIENAEMYGLAQCHQLRGRVGRGDTPSSCLLLYAPPLSDTARRRLAILRETEDGFRIAEEDLLLRGAGEALGVRQSGLPAFRLALLSHHGTLLQEAYEDATAAIEDNPALEGSQGEALRTLLYLFERDDAIRYLRSG